MLTKAQETTLVAALKASVDVVLAPLVVVRGLPHEKTTTRTQ